MRGASSLMLPCNAHVFPLRESERESKPRYKSTALVPRATAENANELVEANQPLPAPPLLPPPHYLAPPSSPLSGDFHPSQPPSSPSLPPPPTFPSEPAKIAKWIHISTYFCAVPVLFIVVVLLVLLRCHSLNGSSGPRNATNCSIINMVAAVMLLLTTAPPLAVYHLECAQHALLNPT